MSDVTIYTTAVCPFCVSAKTLLSRLGVPYKEVNLEKDPELRMRLSKENNGWRTVPMIFAGERFLGGFDDINALHQKGELLPILKN